MRTAQTKKGFTLVELLVVVSIIAILAGLLIPAIGRARYNGLKANDINNAKRIAEAIIAYSLDEGGIPRNDRSATDDAEALASLQILAQNSDGELPKRLFESSVNGETNDIGRIGNSGTGITWDDSAGPHYNYDYSSRMTAATPLVSNGGDDRGNAVVTFGDASTTTLKESSAQVYYLEDDVDEVDDIHTTGPTSGYVDGFNYGIHLRGGRGYTP